jgi:hypothetical protein
MAEKKHVAMQKLFFKKRKKEKRRIKVLEKNGQVSEILKQWVL